MVYGDGGHIFGGRGQAQDLVAVHLALHLGQVAEGEGDPGGKVRNVGHLDQELSASRTKETAQCKRGGQTFICISNTLAQMADKQTNKQTNKQK